MNVPASENLVQNILRENFQVPRIKYREILHCDLFRTRVRTDQVSRRCVVGLLLSPPPPRPTLKHRERCFPYFPPPNYQTSISRTEETELYSVQISFVSSTCLIEINTNPSNPSISYSILIILPSLLSVLPRNILIHFPRRSSPYTTLHNPSTRDCTV